MSTTRKHTLILLHLFVLNKSKIVKMKTKYLRDIECVPDLNN